MQLVQDTSTAPLNPRRKEVSTTWKILANIGPFMQVVLMAQGTLSCLIRRGTLGMCIDPNHTRQGLSCSCELHNTAATNVVKILPELSCLPAPYNQSPSRPRSSMPSVTSSLSSL